MPLPRRYSCALRRSVRSGSCVPSSIVASTIGRSPEIPYFHSSGCPRRFFDDRVRRAQARIAEEQPAREPLEPHRVFDGEPEVAQLDLRVRAGERDARARRRGGRDTSR